jgi:hypothetical protein
MGKDIVEHVLLEFAMLVAVGTAGGTPPPIDPQILMERSLTVVAAICGIISSAATPAPSACSTQSAQAR